MKFKDYLERLNAMAKATPALLDCDVIYSIDDEGNAFNEVHYYAGTGNYDGREFEPDLEPVNAIVLN